MWLTARITPPVRGTFSRPRQSRFVNSRSSGLSTTTTSRYQKPSFPRRTRDLRSSRRLPAWIDCPGSTAGSAGDEPRSLRSLAGAPDSCRATPAGQDRVVRWVLVVPVKRLLVAKSRLAPLAGPLRTDLARAMALDTVAGTHLPRGGSRPGRDRRARRGARGLGPRGPRGARLPERRTEPGARTRGADRPRPLARPGGRGAVRGPSRAAPGRPGARTRRRHRPPSGVPARRVRDRDDAAVRACRPAAGPGVRRRVPGRAPPGGRGRAAAARGGVGGSGRGHAG